MSIQKSPQLASKSAAKKASHKSDTSKSDGLKALNELAVADQVARELSAELLSDAVDVDQQPDREDLDKLKSKKKKREEEAEENASIAADDGSTGSSVSETADVSGGSPSEVGEPVLVAEASDAVTTDANSDVLGMDASAQSGESALQASFSGLSSSSLAVFGLLGGTAAVGIAVGAGGGSSGGNTTPVSTSTNSGGAVAEPDTSAPNLPILSTPSLTTNDATPMITGRAEPNSRVSIFDRSVLLGETMADGQGNFSFTPSTPTWTPRVCQALNR